MMEIIIPTPRDFEFASATSTPFASAPSTPRRFGADFYFSAPTSPTHLSEFYSEFDNFSPWEGEDDGTPKLPNGGSGFEDDFAFDFNQDLENKTLPAEVLFDGGKIRKSDESFRAPSSPISRIRQALSPRKKKQIDPLVSDHKRERGRGRSPTNSLPSSSSRRARSVSPHRVSEHPWEGKHEHHHNQQQEQEQKQISIIPKPSLTATKSTLSKGSSSRKWRLKDLFLFRSASEGRGTDKDPFKKYTDLFKKHEDIRNSSFRSTEGYSNSGSKGSSRRRGPISAHELHYTVNRAVSEDLKKKTFLPYKQGILGRLAFNPTVHALTNGFGFSRK